MPTTDPKLALLHELGAGDIDHNSDESLVHHLAGVRALLLAWGARPSLCDAGLFHSIYGTEYFQQAALSEDQRGRVRQALGQETESLVWLWCFGRRTTLSDQTVAGPTLADRKGGVLKLNAQQQQDLANLWYADTLEQLERKPEREVPTLTTLARYRSLVLPAAAAAFDAISRQWSEWREGEKR